MSDQIQAIRGMADILPPETAVWSEVESTIRGILGQYGYGEIRVPIVERTDLFSRSIGEVTDVVEKEMYTFLDRNEVSLTLRPEATAGIVRAAMQHGLLRNPRHKLWCTGPMFRYEKPQKGRYRQFHQFSVEALGYAGPDVDAELILMSARLWEALGIRHVALQINSLGTPQARGRYREALAEYFGEHRDALDPDSRRRLERNPLRILDSKHPEMQAVIADAPSISAYLDADSQQHFDALRLLLDDAGLAYEINPRLVRGLDYYSRTVFEWVTDQLGTQGAVCAGGRYDGLVEQLGGPATPAVGWALGLERLVELYRLAGRDSAGNAPQVYVVAVGDGALRAAFRLTERLRRCPAGWRIELNCGGGSFKAQLKRADRSGASLALILGDDEAAGGRAGIKPLRDDRPQQDVAWDDLERSLSAYLTSSQG